MKYHRSQWHLNSLLCSAVAAYFAAQHLSYTERVGTLISERTGQVWVARSLCSPYQFATLAKLIYCSQWTLNTIRGYT